MLTSYGAGNIDGQYAANVGPKGNAPSMNWDTDSWSGMVDNNQ